MKVSYTFCDGCGDFWPGEGDGATAPGLVVTLKRAHRDVAPEQIHVCSITCLQAYAMKRIENRRVSPKYAMSHNF